ncbi:MAG: sigma-54 dependent transcriptional regulator [Dokdonella sp.]
MSRVGTVASVLIVDDNVEFQSTVADLAALADCAVTRATSLRAARRLARDGRFDLVVLDLDLPDGSGLDLLDEIDLATLGEIAVVTGHPSVDSAIRAVRLPIVDYLVKPIAPAALERLFERARLHARAHPPGSLGEFSGMVGQSAQMKALFDRIDRVARHDMTVFIHGESGTGKELVARAVHERSGRTGEFVALKCGAVAPDLLSSQLFGHERGAFTGAVQSHAGFFERAQGGTLFLDEITEMPATLQVYLLRVLETRTLTRVGGSREIPIDVRVIAATNRDPSTAVADGSLRGDLYYRLADFPIALPPLRERPADIALLAQRFLDRLNERYDTRRFLTNEVVREWTGRPWPGNVRELRHVVQRAYVLAPDDAIGATAEPSPAPIERHDGSVTFRVGMTFDEIEREMLLKTLAHHGNNRRQAARTLGITTKTIYNRLLRYRALGLIGDDQLGSEDDED